MTKIDIDKDVFEFLQKNAIPFVDTPNTVLRRLLKIDKATTPPTNEGKLSMTNKNNESNIDTSDFVRKVLEKELPEGSQRKAPYRFMFESPNALIYFQNFNQPSATLWYRVTAKPLRILKESGKKSFICLTNPSESVAYKIPLEEIKNKIISSNWTRDYLEINIDHVSKKWKELDWNIEKYLKFY